MEVDSRCVGTPFGTPRSIDDTFSHPSSGMLGTPACSNSPVAALLSFGFGSPSASTHDVRPRLIYSVTNRDDISPSTGMSSIGTSPSINATLVESSSFTIDVPSAASTRGLQFGASEQIEYLLDGLGLENISAAEAIVMFDNAPAQNILLACCDKGMKSEPKISDFKADPVIISNRLKSEVLVMRFQDIGVKPPSDCFRLHALSGSKPKEDITNTDKYKSESDRALDVLKWVRTADGFWHVYVHINVNSRKLNADFVLEVDYSKYEGGRYSSFGSFETAPINVWSGKGEGSGSGVTPRASLGARQGRRAVQYNSATSSSTIRHTLASVNKVSAPAIYGSGGGWAGYSHTVSPVAEGQADLSELMAVPRPPSPVRALDFSGRDEDEMSRVGYDSHSPAAEATEDQVGSDAGHYSAQDFDFEYYYGLY